MDIAALLQSFENSMSSYAGEDPLEQWDKFVDYVEKRLPAGVGSGMAAVLERLVERFLTVTQYANDTRYVNYCIRCATYSSNPIALYSRIFGSGVGTRAAALYVAWAQQFEQRGMNEQADAVYQKAMENQAQPADAVVHEYRQFQARTRSHTPGWGVRNPLQDSQLTNHMLSHREPVAQIKASGDCAPKQPKLFVTVSRSETSGMIPFSHGSSVQTESQYNKDALACEGSELCFEEVRALKYFHKQREKHYRENQEKLREEEKGVLSIQSLFDNQELKEFGLLIHQRSSQRLQQLPGVRPGTSLNLNPAQQNHLNTGRFLGFRPHIEPTFVLEEAAAPAAPARQQQQTRAADPTPLTSHTSHHPSVVADRSVAFPLTSVSVDPAPTCQTFVVQQQVNHLSHRPACISAVDTDLLPQEAQHQPAGLGETLLQEQNITVKEVGLLQDAQDKLDTSLGGTANLSHITPNNSLGLVQATPSRVLPSPTVNTREALDVIMDMFQAPTLLVDPLSNVSGCSGHGCASTSSKLPTTTPFTIFQDEGDKENLCAAAPSAPEKPKAARALAVIPVPKPNDTLPEVMPDESTMWGARYNSLSSLAACPNSTTDFAKSAQCVSTPFTHKNAFSFFQDQENNCDGADAEDDAFNRRQAKKLSPIIEQSPCDEKLSETAISQIVPSSARHGTIVGEGLSSAQHCLTTSSITMVQPPPPAVLSFRDQTLCASESSAPRTTGPVWEVYTSPEQPSKQTSLALQEAQGPFMTRCEPFKVFEDLPDPGSAEKAQTPDYDVPMSPECTVDPDWLAFQSPELTAEPDLNAFLSPHQSRVMDVPMSPEQPLLCADMFIGRTQSHTLDESMMSPDRGLRPNGDVTLNATPSKTAAVQLVPDPWDSELISDLLSTLSPPLTSHPRCITWQSKLPNISPKMTLSMGKASLRVDGILGEGAFATVFQATDPVTSEKVVLKVQKPASPWEFYINTQLDDRLQPDVRHLYSNIRSAHIFNNGSVLVGELHSYGTLLNAVNIYKTLSDKVMPQPLVMYFTICILHMVEQLHSIKIIHADIKPDNFLLGERFLDNKGFCPDSVNHGLVLVDLGQSIDMKLFPEGTAFTARCLTSGFQCTEMLSGKPWSYQTDYFGVAGTVHCLLFGTYMQVRNEGGVWKTDAVFRRNPHSELWLDVFHTLLNVPAGGPQPGGPQPGGPQPCGPPPSLRSLRCRLASVLQQHYSSKLATLKSRLMVLLLENRKPARK